MLTGLLKYPVVKLNFGMYFDVLPTCTTLVLNITSSFANMKYFKFLMIAWGKAIKEWHIDVFHIFFRIAVH